MVILDVDYVLDEESNEFIENEKLLAYYVKLGFDRAKNQKKDKTVLYFDLKKHIVSTGNSTNN